MMNLLIKLKCFILITLLLSLSACNQAGVKEEEQTKPDLIELQKQADQAYLNDEFADAERNYEILINELPKEALHWFRLGNIYVRTNRPAAAINLYKEAVIRDPSLAKAWFNMSIVQLKQTAYSLNEMLIYTDKDDPMYSKAKNLLDGIESIVKQDNE